jgi:hypothetical protein
MVGKNHGTAHAVSLCSNLKDARQACIVTRNHKFVAVHNVFGHNGTCLLHLLQEMDLARLARAFFLGCANLCLALRQLLSFVTATKKGILMHTTKVFEYLKKHGQLLDLDIAAATNISLDEVRASLSELSARGDISRCSVTSYVKGKAIEGFQCRLSGFVPRPAPGRKPGAK